jgi:hypothetical protein
MQETVAKGEPFDEIRILKAGVDCACSIKYWILYVEVFGNFLVGFEIQEFSVNRRFSQS